jgi:hypothetical protein
MQELARCLYHYYSLVSPLVLNFVSTDRAKTALQDNTCFMGWLFLYGVLDVVVFLLFWGYTTTLRVVNGATHWAKC